MLMGEHPIQLQLEQVELLIIIVFQLEVMEVIQVLLVNQALAVVDREEVLVHYKIQIQVDQVEEQLIQELKALEMQEVIHLQKVIQVVMEIHHLQQM